MPTSPPSTLPWVTVASDAPCFQTEDGQPWHPIGQNDAISWHELNPLFRRRNPLSVEAHFANLAAHGVTCMRLMLEYAQVRHRYFETAPGVWSPNIVRLWDDLFALAERNGIRFLLTPFDTFFLWSHFRHHPYNAKHGGPLTHPSRTLLCQQTRKAIRARLTFAAERWGGSGALFAWDLWNEIHPAHAEMSAEPFAEFISDLSAHVRSVETRSFGRAHPQTVSIFGPDLQHHAAMQMERDIFRHPSLDFATIHIYQTGTIDYPRNTVDPAIDMGRIVRDSIAQIDDRRPFLDTEHGPIHSFKDRHITFPEPFDDEYFRHMQWAHLASGGAGGGMRWPNRHPHSLTSGMRLAQKALSRFMPCIDWLRFNRRNVTADVELFDSTDHTLTEKRLARFACATEDQALVYLLRRDTLLPDGRVDPNAPAITPMLRLPLHPGLYSVTVCSTLTGHPVSTTRQSLMATSSISLPGLVVDFVIAVRRQA